MRVSEDKVAQVPAAGLALRTLLLHGEEQRKQRDEPLALSGAPVTPDAHLLRIYCVMRDLRRPRINDNAEWDVSLLQFPPKEVHFGLLPNKSSLDSQRRIADFVGVLV